MQKQSGFGIVEIIITVVVLVLIGIGGWYVWSASQRGQTNGSNNSSSSSNNATPTDPYAGWRSYCDSAHGACFKYPADWQITINDSTEYGSARVTNPDESVVVTYNNPDTRDGSNETFYTASVDDLTQSMSGYKVVGGYVIPAGLAPGYWLVNGPFLKDSLQPGQQSEYVNSPRFVNRNDFYATLMAAPKDATANETESKAWFASEDAKIAKLIVRSFYLQE